MASESVGSMAKVEKRTTIHPSRHALKMRAEHVVLFAYVRALPFVVSVTVEKDDVGSERTKVVQL